MAIRHRTPFAPEFNFVVLRPFTYNGHDYSVGDDFDKANVNERMLRKLYDSRNIEAVIPSFTLKQDEAEAEVDAPQKAEPAPAVKAKGRGKRKANVEQEMPEAPAAPARFRLDENFGVYRIFEGDNLIRECADLDEARAAMAELSEG